MSSSDSLLGFRTGGSASDGGGDGGGGSSRRNAGGISSKRPRIEEDSEGESASFIFNLCAHYLQWTLQHLYNMTTVSFCIFSCSI